MTDLDQQLRRTLTAVAATLDTEPAPTTAPRRRRRRGFVVGAGLAVAAVPLAAGAALVLGPEHVDRIPPPDPLLSGTLDGERYWVVDAFHEDQCDRPVPGVELVIEENNVVGQEWDTVVYSPHGDGSCGSAVWPDDPSSAYYTDGGSTIGDGMLWMGVLEGEVDEVRATAGGEPIDVQLLPHEGDDYFVVEVPAGTAWFTVDYLVDGQVVAPPSDESNEHQVP